MIKTTMICSKLRSKSNFTTYEVAMWLVAYPESKHNTIAHTVHIGDGPGGVRIVSRVVKIMYQE